MSPLARVFQARGVALAEFTPEAWAPACFSTPREEHLATRRAAALFDFSFMGLWEFASKRSLTELQKVQTRNLARLDPGQLAYTLLLREDGSVFDDATIWCLAQGRFWLFTGRRSDTDWIQRHATASDRSGEHAVLALQGPASGKILAGLVGRETVLSLRYFRFVIARDMVVGRLGYSGELGYELLVSASRGPALWQRLAELGRSHGLHECGFAAADSLRIESGYVLFGREIAGHTNPFELGLERLAEIHGREVIGSRALAARRFREPERRLCGLELEAPRAAARAWAGLPLAHVTSECDSPQLRKRIALGFVGAGAAAPGSSVRTADGRLGRVARLPFYDPGRHVARASRPPA